MIGGEIMQHQKEKTIKEKYILCEGSYIGLQTTNSITNEKKHVELVRKTLE